MLPRFNFLETSTLYPTAGLALCRHKRVVVANGAPYFRIPKVTAATDRAMAVRVLANTFMRVVDNCSLENHAVEEIEALGASVRTLGYSNQMVVDGWQILVNHARYVGFGRRWRCVQRELHDTLTR